MSDLQVSNELLDARMKEVTNEISNLNLGDFYNAEVYNAAREIIGIRLDLNGYNLITISTCIRNRLCKGSMTPDEAIAHLNNLPIGLQIADMQRELNKDIFPTEANNFDELESNYEDGLSNGDYPSEVTEYVAALEDKLNDAQGALFRLNGELMALNAKSENTAFVGDKCLAQYNLDPGLSNAANNLVEQVLYERERILKRELVKAGVDIDNHSEVIKRCKKISYGDGSEQFVIDGIIVVQFSGGKSNYDFGLMSSLGPIKLGASYNCTVTRIKPDC